MVLKKISILMLVLAAQAGLANYQEMNQAFQNERYEQVLEIYEENENDNKSKNFKIQKILGLALKKLKSYQEALRIFTRASNRTKIRKTFDSIDKQLDLPEDQRKEIEGNKKEIFLANQLAHLHSLIFLETNELSGDQAKKKFYQTAKRSIERAILLDEDMDRNHELLEQINDRYRHYTDLKYSRSYYVLV